MQGVNQGHCYLITRGGRPFANLSPLQPIAAPQVSLALVDPDTARRVQVLANQYQHHTLATLLDLTDSAVTILIQTGLADEPLFQRLVFLETLAQIIFPHPSTITGRRWLTRPHPLLKHHPPLFVLRRALSKDEHLAATILDLARSTFRP
ncbi:hypothetical protein K5D85_00755 [Deinococcus sp. RIT780]|nr:hypothetical protein [Deinococcus sp. RIT780]